MNIILGFGSTEKDFEQQEFNFVTKFIKENAVRDEYGYCSFNDGFIELLKEKITERSLHYRKLVEEYKSAATYPNRYSSYYFDIVHNIINICIVYKFSHTNRNHPMSPDGWAVLWNTGVHHVAYDDFN